MKRFLFFLPTLVLVLLASPTFAAMNHNMTGSHAAYSDRVFLSGMIAHHEGAVLMSEHLLKAPGSQKIPQVEAWAKAIIAAQNEEIDEMRALLKTMGGIDQAAYQTMAKGMHAMLQEKEGAAPDMRFVALMLPHHAQAVEMSLPVLLYSDNARVLELAKSIVMSQGDEMYQFRMWLNAHDKHPARKHTPGKDTTR